MKRILMAVMVMVIAAGAKPKKDGQLHFVPVDTGSFFLKADSSMIVRTTPSYCDSNMSTSIIWYDSEDSVYIDGKKVSGKAHEVQVFYKRTKPNCWY